MKYANHMAYTDINPYEVIRVISDQTLEIRRMKTEIDPDDKPQFVPGGFSAICTHSGSHIISSDPNGEILRIRKSKKKRLAANDYWTYKGMKFLLSDKPVHYYDYNF